MLNEQRKVSFSITGEEKISAVYLAEIFQHLQNILYNIGDHIEGNAPRSKGVYPQSIKESCSLVVTGLSTGSVHAELQIGDMQTSLPEMQTIGERTISIAGDLLETISESEISEHKLFDLINNHHRLNRILREFNDIFPDTQSKLKLNFKFGYSHSRNLDSAQKEAIQSLLNKPPEEYEKEVLGRLFELRVDKKRQFKIDSSEGLINCQYSSEIEDIIIKSIGDFVRIRGIMKPTQKGTFILGIDDETSIETLTQFPLTSIKIGSTEKQLNEPIFIDITIENDQFIVSNGELGLFLVAPSMKLAYEGIQEELAILWSEYVEANDEDLTVGAIEFKHKLSGLLT
jgi:hypothetical protein